jgi:hypothetical protein
MSLRIFTNIKIFWYRVIALEPKRSMGNSSVAASWLRHCIRLRHERDQSFWVAGISPWTSSHYQKDIASLQTHPSRSQPSSPSLSAAKSLLPKSVRRSSCFPSFLVPVPARKNYRCRSWSRSETYFGVSPSQKDCGLGPAETGTTLPISNQTMS